MLDSLDLTMDENKENQTPDGVQGELDWVQQYNLDQEREEQELQQALAQSLQEHVRDPALWLHFMCASHGLRKKYDVFDFILHRRLGR